MRKQFFLAFLLLISSLLGYAETIERIEAETFDEVSGARAESNESLSGGGNVGYITDGTWIKFSDHNFNEFNLRFDIAHAGGNGGTIEFRLDNANGTLISKAVVPSTSGWGDYKMVSSDIVVETGTHDLYLVFKGGSGYLFNIDYFEIYTNNPNAVVYNLTTNVSPEESGVVTKNLSGTEFDEGTKITLTAEDNFGYDFVQWVDSTGSVISGENPLTITIAANTTIIAEFEKVTTHAFDFQIVGSAWGIVNLNPEPVNGRYEAGTIVGMTVQPNEVASFLNWEDFSTGLIRTVQMDVDKSFTAYFDEVPFIVGWDFKVAEPKADRPGDYYSSFANPGLFSVVRQDGSTTSWLARSQGGYSPLLPCINFWTPASQWPVPNAFQATFSTESFENIQVSSKMSGSYHGYSVMTMEYSLDGTNFTKLDSVDLAAVWGNAWADFNVDLPGEANDQAQVYVRWIADTTSPVMGNAVDVDGTAITNVFIYADEIMAPDSIAPSLVSSVPANNSVGASSHGSIVLTFDERMKMGNGACTLDDEVLAASFGSKTVTFSYSKLEYNTDYTFTVPAGALTDMSGNAFEGASIHFKTMDRTQPIMKLFDAVIAKDGTGDYETVQDAIDNVPENRTLPWLIFVKNGTYTGHVDIPSTKPYIHLIGQQRDSVLISDNRMTGEDGNPETPSYSVDLGATVVVKSTDCYFENIIFENSYGVQAQSGPQALAMYTNGDRVTFKNCWFRSYQDTYLTTTTSGKGYLKNCNIEGAVDYIYGGGDYLFDECTLTCTRPQGGYIVAPAHAVGTEWGYVFSNCTIDGAKGVVTYFGRPWHNAPKTVFLNTICKIGIYPVGWTNMGTVPAIFADYNTMDVNGNPLDLSQRKSEYTYTENGETKKGTAKNFLTDEEAAEYTYENIILGDGSWDPKAIMETTEAPLISLNDSLVAWNVVDYAMCYVVIENDQVVKFTTDTTFIEEKYDSTQTYSYTVQAVSGYGSLSAHSNVASNKKESSISWAAPDDIFEGTALGELQLNATVKGTTGAAIYDPPAGTVLTPGTHSLKVTFEEDERFLSVTDSVTIRVLPYSGGFANVPGRGVSNTTGGDGGNTVVVTSLNELKIYATSADPYVILVNGSIEADPWEQIDVSSNKTLVGYGDDATLRNIELHINQKQNIIIRNLAIRDSRVPEDVNGKEYDYDAIQADYSNHLWIDHCFLTYCNDGLIDLRLITDFVTVSWNHLSEENKAFGIGWTDSTNFNITIHHNWIDNTNQRNPSFGNGNGHLYNNYLSNITSYGNYARGDARNVIQNSWFYKVNNPLSYDVEAKLYSEGNQFVECTGTKNGNVSVMPFDPADFYTYTLDPTDQVVDIVTEGAGPQWFVGNQYISNLPKHSLNITVVEGQGTVTPESGMLLANGLTHIKALPEPGWKFDHWGGDLSGSIADTVILLDADKTIEAHFVEDESVNLLNIEIKGKGTVTPESGYFPVDESVQLSAKPDDGWVFDHWSGDLTGSAAEATVLLDADKSVTAHFVEDTSTKIDFKGQENQIKCNYNPVKRTIRILTNEVQNGNLALYSIDGRKVLSKVLIHTNGSEFSVENLHSGVYIVGLEMNNRYHTQRIVVY